MKKTTLFLLNLLFVSFALNAQNKVEHLEIMGKAYTVTKVFPEEILGEYTYEGNGGDPKVLLNKNGTGYFQPHQVKPVDIIFWIDCDENGVWRKQTGATGRYQYTLVIQYQDGGTTKNYEKGKYDLMGVMVLKDLGRAVIYGERYKKL
ncbi:MAG: hypothetical protein ACOVMI_10300 [Chitinophagaceae bacterium]|jgi:hypothetical protein